MNKNRAGVKSREQFFKDQDRDHKVFLRPKSFFFLETFVLKPCQNREKNCNTVVPRFSISLLEQFGFRPKNSS